ELDRIDTVAIRLTVVRRELPAEQAASQREAIIAAGYDRVGPEAETGLDSAAGNDGALEAHPVLLKQQLVGAIVETEGQLLLSCRACRERGIDPATNLQALRIEQPAGISPLQPLHEQPALGSGGALGPWRFDSFRR